MNAPAQPPRRLKLLFWLTLGAYSTFFAEVIAGSDLFPFFHLWGLLIVVPIYTLHTLLLASLVVRNGAPRFPTLFLAGAIFGMYEAYLTKILWSPTWSEAPLRLSGVAVPEFIILVLFWHPLLSFVVPVLVGETLLTGSRAVLGGLPDPVRRRFSSQKAQRFLLPALAVALPLIAVVNSPSPLHSLASGLSSTVVLLLLTYIWREKTDGKRYDLKALLPNQREACVLLVPLLLLYLVLGLLDRREALPDIVGHLTIWAIYGVLFGLLALSLKKSRKASSGADNAPTGAFCWRQLISLAALFAISSALGRLFLEPLGEAIVLLVWIGGGAVGVMMFCLAAWDTVAGDRRGKARDEDRAIHREKG